MALVKFPFCVNHNGVYHKPGEAFEVENMEEALSLGAEIVANATLEEKTVEKVQTRKPRAKKV